MGKKIGINSKNFEFMPLFVAFYRTLGLQNPIKSDIIN